MSAKQLFKDPKGIIISADVYSLEELDMLSVLAASRRQVVGIKIGFILGLRFGLSEAVKTIRNRCGVPVIYDHQKAATDIPAMGEPFAEVCRDAGLDSVIFFPQAGPKTLEAFVKGAQKFELTPIVGISMTHPAYLKSEGGFIDDEAPGKICKIAVDLGVSAFVLPGAKPHIVEKYAQGPLDAVRPAAITMPGIGTQGGSITEAFKAAAGHHPYAIVGSAIYKARDPQSALDDLIREMESLHEQ